MEKIEKLKEENTKLRARIEHLQNEMINKNQYICKLENMLFANGKW